MTTVLAALTPCSDVRRHALPYKPGRDEAASGPGSWMGDVMYTVEDSKAVLLWNDWPDENPGDITKDMPLYQWESM